MLFIGIDGGGTKTNAILCNEDGKILVKTTSEAVCLLDYPKEVVYKNLKRVLDPIKSKIDGVNEKIVSVIGMPAVGEIRNIENEYAKIFERIMGFKVDMVVNDVVVGWAGGTLGEDGIHIVAGTGSIAYGKYKGKEMRSGGWGNIIGDEGSAYHIGLESLRVISMQIDGRLKESILKKIVFDSLSFKDHYDFLEWLYLKKEGIRKKIASIASITYKAALEGDEISISILKNAGKELLRLVMAIAEGLNFYNPYVSFSGSVLEKNEIVRDSFINNLNKSLKNAKIEKARFSPMLGAVILGMKIMRKDIPKSFVHPLRPT